MKTTTTKAPKFGFDELARWGTKNLTDVIAIDSQSNERSETIPSTEGQRELSNFLQTFFKEMGYEGHQDAQANLIVKIPSNLNPGETAPTLAFMVHMDTSEGTKAVPCLEVVEAWDGSRIPYPDNDRLEVTADNYESTRPFVGDDVLHGPGRFPIGLDDKLGMSELMTLAQILSKDSDIKHGEVLLVFRPDEEIGRMEAVEGLADELKRRGVTHGYTIDGLAPFEINVENFNAARARIKVEDKPLKISQYAVARQVNYAICGVNTHGATAKPEGYLNATAVCGRIANDIRERPEIIPVDFQTDMALECNAKVSFVLTGGSQADLDSQETWLTKTLEAEITPHKWRGAQLSMRSRDHIDPKVTPTVGGAVKKVFDHLSQFLSSPGPAPKLSEHSDGYDGYTNPHAILRHDGYVTLDYRVRDFTTNGLTARSDNITEIARLSSLDVDVTQQYVNMGSVLSQYPELVTWAEAALTAIDQPAMKSPIRGGTGVDPFLERGIPVANLGTGYFAPESEKELTSKQNIARHALWLTHLVQVVTTTD